MWSDLNMHDRHKLIRLAVTNGVYDLDTIRSLYDNNEYKDGGNMRIAPYKDNASYPDRKLYRNVKRDFRKDPEAEYKDYDEYGVRIYNPSLSSNAPNRKERQEVMLERIRQDFPEIQKNDVKKTAFKSNTLGWHNSNTGFMGNEDKRILYGLQQEYDFVNNIVPYAKLGMETPESIQRRKELERKNRNTTYEYTTNFDFGGNLQTESNRTLPPVDRTIEMLRMKALEKALMEQSQNIPNVMPVNDAIAYNYVKPYVAPQPEVVNLTDVLNKKNYTDIKRTVPVAEARPTFINTYEKGGPKDQPKHSYQWQDDSQKYVKPSNGTQGTSSEVFSFDNPIDPWNRFNYNQGNYIKSGIVTDTISLGLMAAPTIAPYIAEGLASPVTTVASQIPQLGKYSYMLPTLDKALWAATGASGLYNRVSNEGVQGITNHPFLTAMDLGMLSPVAKGIKTVGNEAMWKYTPGLRTGIEMSRNVRNTKLNPNVELPAVTRFKLDDLPTTEMPKTTNLLSQMSEHNRYKDFDFFHGGLDENFDFNTLDILRPGIKQAKKNHQYAGFYMNDLDHLAGSFRYGQGTAHGIKLKNNYKLIDLGEYNIEKMKTDELQKYIEQGYDILKGNNIWSQPEYILLNKNAILNTKFFDTPPIDYMETPHRTPFLKQKRIKEIQNLTNNE